MTDYEITTTVISILSLFATIFFGIAVLLLSRKANEIAEESIKIQKESITARIDQKEKEITEHFKDPENLTDFNKIQNELQKNFTYNTGLSKLKATEYKEWKRKNELAKKHFLKQKK